MLRNLRSSLHNARIPLLAVFWTCSIVITVNDKFLEVTYVDGGSMAPTLSADYHATGQKDAMAWRKLLPTHKLQRGDIVNFDNPVNPNAGAIKRVVALPGDTVVLDPRRRPLLASGECLEGRAWDAWKGRVVIPEGHVWVEGDNWRRSLDSNWYGPISKSLITGKAVALVLPLRKFGEKPVREYKSRTAIVPAKGDAADNVTAAAEIERG